MIQRKKRDSNENFLFYPEIRGHHTALVIDYADEELRSRLVNPDEILIRDEEITIRFTYPLSKEVLVTHKQKDGFSMMDNI